jgi:hypothetical protein
MNKKRALKRFAAVAGGFVAILVMLYLWLVLSPTGVEEAREQMRASEQKVRTILTLPAPTPPAETALNPRDAGAHFQTLQNEFQEQHSGAVYVIYTLGGSIGQYGNASQTIPKSEGDAATTVSCSDFTVSTQSAVDAFHVQWWSHLAIPETADTEGVHELLDAYEPLLRTVDWASGGRYEYWSASHAHYAATPLTWVTLRAHVQEDDGKTTEFLRAFFAYAYSTHAHTLENQQHFTAWSFPVFLLLLEDIRPLPEETLRELLALSLDAHFDREEYNAVRVQYIRNELANLKDPAEKENTWHFLLGGLPEKTIGALGEPVYQRALDEMTGAYINGDELAIQSSLAKGSLALGLSNRRSNPIREFDRLFRWEMPAWAEHNDGHMRLFKAQEINAPMDMTAFITASLLFKRETGELPADGQELSPAYLPGEFFERTLGCWVTAPWEGATIAVLPYPEDSTPFGKAATDFRAAHRRLPRDVEELKPFAPEGVELEELRRGFRTYAPRTLFLHIRHDSGQPGVTIDGATNPHLENNPAYRAILSHR